MKLSIIIPAFNEEKTIKQILQRVNDISLGNIQKEVIIINDYSTDNTQEIVNETIKKLPEFKLINHTVNKGKGAAVRTGFSNATGDYIVIQDADLEYNPEYFKTLLQPILNGKTDVVYGSRLTKLPDLKGHGTMSKTRFLVHFFGNRFLSLLTSILYLQWITDMETCYKIFPREFLNKVTLHGEGFNFEPEITAKLIKAGYKIIEIPITTNPRGYDQGKKLQTVPEGIEAIKTLIKYRFID
jgi:glycosyltransferase involved in cell wall biosynthesis